MTLMTTRKIPYWLSPGELHSLSKVLNKESYNYDMLAGGIQEEIGVAHARADSSNISTPALALVLGMPVDSLPLHLSDDEVDFLLSLENLPETVKKRLL